MEALNLAIEAAGGVGKLASSIGVVQSAVSNWRVRGSVPVEHCTAIEFAVLGKITRKDLRPDDWVKHWPELAPSLSNPANVATETVAQGVANV